MYNEEVESKMKEAKRFENDCVENDCVRPMPPPDSRINRLRDIRIQELTRGYVVTVGCAAFAISTKAELVTKLMEYLTNPDETEQKWYAGELFEKEKQIPYLGTEQLK